MNKKLSNIQKNILDFLIENPNASFERGDLCTDTFYAVRFGSVHERTIMALLRMEVMQSKGSKKVLSQKYLDSIKENHDSTVSD